MKPHHPSRVIAGAALLALVISFVAPFPVLAGETPPPADPTAAATLPPDAAVPESEATPTPVADLPVAEGEPTEPVLPEAPSDEGAPGDSAAPAEPGLINPVHLFREMERTLAENSVLVADGGDFVATASYILSPRRPLSWLDPGVFGTLGVGGGFALGAKLCRPDADVWILYGDGSVAYSLAEFDTFARHGIPVIAVVGNDAGWMQIAREQVEILKDDVGTVLARSDYHKVAEGYGGRGLLLNRTEDIPAILDEAVRIARAGMPVLINVHLAKTEFRKGSISM